jgi:hypothetical protein
MRKPNNQLAWVGRKAKAAAGIRLPRLMAGGDNGLKTGSWRKWTDRQGLVHWRKSTLAAISVPDLIRHAVSINSAAEYASFCKSMLRALMFDTNHCPQRIHTRIQRFAGFASFIFLP